MEYYNNILCVEAGWLIDEGIITKSNYDALKRRGWLKQERRACKDTPALVSYDSIPERFKAKIIDLVGDPYKNVKQYGFADQVKPDPEALQYFSEYKLNDSRNLPTENIKEYCANASILNAIHHIINNRVAKRRGLGGNKTNVWENIAKSVENVRSDYGHTLPINARRLRDRYKLYKIKGYDSLIHKNFCNINRLKVTDEIKELLLSIATMPQKPYLKSVTDIYLTFLAGGIDIPDYNTGELYDRSDFYDEEDKPIVLSDATVWNHLQNPKNRAIIAKVRSNGLEYNSIHRPHHHRKLPLLALSQISMDDRDLSRKHVVGYTKDKKPIKSTVKAYYAYDVTSGCIIGAAYSKAKDTGLFIDCMRDMFRNLTKWGLGVPLEPEVEHHLVNNFKDDLMKAGIVFPFVRWGNPGNSQEKYAEIMHKVKKYRYEKDKIIGTGRFYAKREADRPKVDKIFDEENNNYKEKVYDYDKIVADDKEINQMHNNDLHPDQKKHEGLTRLQVLLTKANPNLAKIDDALLSRYIGDKTETSIRRSQYVQVQYENYQLSHPSVIEKLQPNNYKVEAYYIPEPDGTINQVYIYQGDTLISKCEKIVKYNRATAEQTEADHAAYTEQAKYVAQYDKMIKDGKPKRVAIVENTENFSEIEPESITVPEPENPNSDFEFDDDSEWYKNQAYNNI